MLLNPKDLLSYLKRWYWFKSLALNMRTRVPILRVFFQIPAMRPQSEPGKWPSIATKTHKGLNYNMYKQVRFLQAGGNNGPSFNVYVLTSSGGVRRQKEYKLWHSLIPPLTNTPVRVSPMVD